jgi:glycosyltransferase involved in cell wall biosynthesis
MSFTISAVIITFNEERNIERCIRSLDGVVEEVIVLDSFSKDRTVELIEVLGAKVIQREWKGYSNAKNFANDQCTGEYILSIDADEALSEELKMSILDIKSQDKKGVWSFNRLTNYCGKWIYHGGWYPDIKIRLFPKAIAKWAGEFVHEELTFSDNVEVELLNGHLDHYSYYSHEDHRERADKYSSLTAQKHFAAGKKANLVKPYLSGIMRFISMFIVKKGFMDGLMGFKIAWISAQSNVFKYQEVRRLQREQAN